MENQMHQLQQEIKKIYKELVISDQNRKKLKFNSIRFKLVSNSGKPITVRVYVGDSNVFES